MRSQGKARPTRPTAGLTFAGGATSFTLSNLAMR